MSVTIHTRTGCSQSHHIYVSKCEVCKSYDVLGSGDSKAGRSRDMYILLRCGVGMYVVIVVGVVVRSSTSTAVILLLAVLLYCGQFRVKIWPW